MSKTRWLAILGVLTAGVLGFATPARADGFRHGERWERHDGRGDRGGWREGWRERDRERDWRRHEYRDYREHRPRYENYRYVPPAYRY